MKKLIFSKAAGAVMIGLFFQSGVVHAADANDVVQVAIGGDSPSLTSNYEAWSKLQGTEGPQGPLRTDMMDDAANSQSQPAEPTRIWPETFDN
ncbi:MAG: hypothetical protein WCA83_12855 [Azonexus sp.]